MKKIVHMGLLLTLLLGLVGFISPISASAPKNYVVAVGAENTSTGVSLMSFFPQTVRLHVGDSITWKSASHEIHTVTFLAGQPMPETLIPAPAGMISPLQFNPLVAFPVVPTGGLYNGTTYVNSGVMSTDPGMVTTFKLTFTRQGVFPYVCVIHGQMMSGTIEVVPSNVPIPTPGQVLAQAKIELAAAWSGVPAVLAQANGQIIPPVKNQDGSLTHTIIMGYESMNVMVMRFLPGNEVVKPGDTVIWKLSTSSPAPHTVTFYNGAPDQPLIIIAQGPDGPVALVNPAVLFPSPAVISGEPLNNTDYFNSGILIPGVQDTFALKIGNITSNLSYDCVLHDSSGMNASLVLAPSFGIK
jgi:plastocyanin